MPNVKANQRIHRSKKSPVRVSRSNRTAQAKNRRVKRSTPSNSNGSKALPGWSELAGGNIRRVKGRQLGTKRLAIALSTPRFMLAVMAIATAFTMYVGHVHATQDLLSEVERIRRHNQNLNLKYNRLKGDFDRMTGPSTIQNRARELGLREDIHFGPTVYVR